MKTLIVYSSRSGNTRKLAETARQVCKDNATLLPVEEAPADLTVFDLISVGFWLQGGKPDDKTQIFLPRVGKRKLFLFATHGAAKGSPHAENGMKAAIAMAPEAELVGTFSCQGQVNPKIMEAAGQKNPPPPWLADAPAAAGHPDSNDLAELHHLLSRLRE